MLCKAQLERVIFLHFVLNEIGGTSFFDIIDWFYYSFIHTEKHQQYYILCFYGIDARIRQEPRNKNMASHIMLFQVMLN